MLEPKANKGGNDHFGAGRVSCNLISGQADMAPAAAPAFAGGVYQEMYPRLEQPREVSIQRENTTNTGKDRCHTCRCGYGQNMHKKIWVRVVRVTWPLGAALAYRGVW